MWSYCCCTIGYREYIEENARNFPVLERGESREYILVIDMASLPDNWQKGTYQNFRTSGKLSFDLEPQTPF